MTIILIIIIVFNIRPSKLRMILQFEKINIIWNIGHRNSKRILSSQNHDKMNIILNNSHSSSRSNYTLNKVRFVLYKFEYTHRKSR